MPLAITCDSPPLGLHLDDASGIVSGAPTVKGTFTFTVLVTDSLDVEAEVECSITIRGKCLVDEG